MKSILALRNLYQKYAHELESSGYSSLADINQQTLAQFSQTVQGKLSIQETTELHGHAKKYVALMQAERRKTITRTNPQLKNIKHLNIAPLNATTRGFEESFAKRDNEYVDKNSVASMFSPAAYLTQLYQQGRLLHPDKSPQHLDTRRPDLQSLTLSQSNLDTEVSTLALSNDILRSSLNETNLDQNMANNLYPFDLPYDASFNNIKATLHLQETSFEQLAESLAPTMPTDSVANDTRHAFVNNLPPALVNDLLAPFQNDEGSLTNLLTRHFGSDASVESLALIETLCRKTGISRNELNSYLTLPVFEQSKSTIDNATSKKPASPDYYGGQYLGLSACSEYDRESSVDVGTKVGAGTSLAINNNQLFQYEFSYTKFTNSYQIMDFSIAPSAVSGHILISVASSQPNSAGNLLIQIDSEEVYRQSESNELKGHYISVQVPIKDTFTFRVIRGEVAYQAETTITFTNPRLIPTIALIKLSQVIRYCQKTGLSPATLDTLIKLSQGEDTEAKINSQTLQLTAIVSEYMKRYSLSEDDAVVLAGGNINIYAAAGEITQFDKLFNTPPLQELYFTTSGQLVFTPDEEDHKFHRAVLKRAFNMNDSELERAAIIVDFNDDNPVENNIINLTDIYFLAILTKIFHITMFELEALWSILSLPKIQAASLIQKAHIVKHFEQVTCWLQTEDLSVYTLQAMLGKEYPTTLTPEIENLLHNLYQSTKEISLSKPIKPCYAPHLAGALKLTSVEQAIVLQDWIDFIAQEQGLSLTSIEKFNDAIILFHNDTSTNENAKNLAAFCQALGQLSIIVKHWQLSEVELALLVSNPTVLPSTSNLLSLTLENLQKISRFKQLQQCCGEGSSELLTTLGNNKLYIIVLSRLFNKPENEIIQAALAIGIHDSNITFNVTQAADINLWLESAEELGVSTRSLHNILKLKLIDTDEDCTNQAADLQGGLPADKQVALSEIQDETLSTALSACYLYEVAPTLISLGIQLNNRNDIFQHLLIDNLVSSRVITTCIAEAISSVQLYINRCLQGMENDLDREQLLDTYFVEWDQYNKRYSTWAGVSKLAYYPENYLDPTLRYNQTKMQEQLLSEISQSQLSKDSIETAYFNYLNGFEDIANLKILSGYHHGVELDKGVSYFIGRTNTAPYRYFWRNLNVESSDGAGGYVASAWGDWEEIVTPLNSENDQVRALIFNNRLYIGWIEKSSLPETDDNGNITGSCENYSLQLSYRKINGSWSPIIAYDLTVNDELLTVGFKLGFYLSSTSFGSTILITLYDSNQEPGYYDNKITLYDSNQAPGYYNDNCQLCTVGEIDNTMEYRGVSDIPNAFKYFSHNLNTTENKNKCIRKINMYNYKGETESSVTTNELEDVLKVNDIGTGCEVNNNTIPAVMNFTAKLQIISPYAPLTFDAYDISNDKTLELYINSLASLTNVDIKPEVLYLRDDVIQQSGLDNIYSGLGFVGPVFRQYRVSFRIYKTTNKRKYLFVGSYAGMWRIDISRGTRAYPEFSNNDDAAKEQYYTLLSTFDELYRKSVKKEPFIFTEQIGFIDIEMLVTCSDSGTNEWFDSNQLYFLYTDNPVLNENCEEEEVLYNQDDLTALEHIIDNCTNLKRLEYQFGDLSGDLHEGDNNIDGQPCPPLEITNTQTEKNIDLVILSGRDEYRKSYNFKAIAETELAINPSDFAQIIQGENQAIYLDLQQTKRTRLNTLFANELIKRASSGLDNVLNWNTQQLPEPKLGAGGYVDVTFAPYTAQTNGDSKWFEIYRQGIDGQKEVSVLLAEGLLSDFQPVTQRVYLAYTGKEAWTNIFHIAPKYSNGLIDISQSQRFSYDPKSDVLSEYTEQSNHLNKGRTPGIINSSVVNTNVEPMDFSGANGLYFWELFYYTPMLVAEQSLKTMNFEEAEKWLKYVYSPQGYLVEGGLAASSVRYWNVRPLEEDTAWDETQTDSTDPDVVAQGDPMHYKVATYMKLQDLLIAHGDMAYRQLERDSLAEAKMWYTSALNLLGDEPDLPKTGNWNEPTLGVAATVPITEEQEQPQSRTANGLIGVFLPTENEKLKGYWQTLNQRLYNLRNNLSIDGQPLTLPLYATPADPKALQNAAAAASANGNTQQYDVNIAIQRFPFMLDNARNLVSQLTQFGSTLASVFERKDSEALSTLLQNQASKLMEQSLQYQDKNIEQLQAEQQTLVVSLDAAKARCDTYHKLLDEGVSRTEQQCIELRLSSGSLAIAANLLRNAGAVLDLAPNTFGMAVGGSHWGSVTTATANGMDILSSGKSMSAEALSTSEQYRRREQEWVQQQEAAEYDVQQIEAQQTSQSIQLEAAQQQKRYLETQQAQTQDQLDYLKTKFSNETLYSWMQGRLSAIFYQFYDLTVARCLKAQLGYQWETKCSTTFIQTGAWDSNHAGLLCGEALMLNLAQMEAAYLEWDERTLEVQRTVSMAQAMELNSAEFTHKIKEVLSDSKSGDQDDTDGTHTIEFKDSQLIATINLSSLELNKDYPENLGNTRRIKQVSVSLPALLGPYQDIQAVLAYSGTGGGIHQSCRHAAISHGLNDSGLFQLDFNDSKYLPFEGLPIVGDDGNSSLSLSFPNAKGKQQALLESLSNIILHIRYTIRN